LLITVTLLPALVKPPAVVPVARAVLRAAAVTLPVGPRVAATAAVSRREVCDEPDAVRAADTAKEVAEGCEPTCGQPRNETTALANTNSTAAPATNDPAVPSPAMYARVARTFSIYRQLL
jgi:hypothetical protein